MVQEKSLERASRCRCNIVSQIARRAVSCLGRSLMRFSIKALTVLLGLSLAASAWAQGTGRSLDIQPGGRQNGMGAAGVALTDDPSATWWNPAALGFMTRNGFELTYAQL